MGVPGLWDILRPAGQQRSLTQLAVVDGFERNPAGRRGLRIGIDASIWFFHATYGREGENPELRTLFFRCARLMSRPFLPLFVFDGPRRPKLKRKKKVSGKDHWMISGMQEIIEAFGFEWRMAPGEAEAELAYLNRVGVIDAIITDDVDTFLFGATMIIRNPGKMLTGNSAHPVRNTAGKDDGEHTYTYSAADILSHEDIALSQGGLILIALLRGGDYDPTGLPNCGPNVAHALARCGFGDTLLDAARTLARARLPAFLAGWRAELRAELRTNARGLLNSKKARLAQALPESFPDVDVLLLYTHPETSERSGRAPSAVDYLWAREPDLGKLAALCERKFEWGVRELIVKRFRTVIWAPAVLRILRRAVLDADEAGPSTPRRRRPRDEGATGTPSKMIARHFSSQKLNDDYDDSDDDDEHRLIVKIHAKRAHASNDGVPEYRLEIAPTQLVRLTEAGVQGVRQLPGKPAGDSDFDDDDGDDDDEFDDDDDVGGGRKKKKGGPKKPPPVPNSHLRVWMPVSMVARAEPALVAAYEGRCAQKDRDKEERAARRAAKTAGAKEKAQPVVRRGAAKNARAEAEEEEEEEELSAEEDFSDVFGLVKGASGTSRAKAAPKRGVGVAKGTKARAMAPVSEEQEEEEEEEPIPAKPAKSKSKSKPNSKPKPKAKPAPSKAADGALDAQLHPNPPKPGEKLRPPSPPPPPPKRSTLLDVLNAQPAWRPSPPEAPAPASGRVLAAPAPFPLYLSDSDDAAAARRRGPAKTGAQQRPRASGSDSTCPGPRKSPRRDRAHVSPTHAKPLLAAQARDAAARSAARAGAASSSSSSSSSSDEEEDTRSRPASPSPMR
ncbi:hypothetical protein DFH11DRAFT_1703479, partial [Phellopilus nigrolimitatus]